MIWHVVFTEEGLILAIFSALSHAQEVARQRERTTGLPTFVHSGIYTEGSNPKVGQTISMKGIK